MRMKNISIITEILCDNIFVRYKKDFLSRSIIYEKIIQLQEQKQIIRLCLPLFSRKPVSPIKNKGGGVDLAEIASLLRCYVLAKMISTVYEYGVEFVIFADGYKYQRACQTPSDIIQMYQDGLHYWCNFLGINDLVKIIDYESNLKLYLTSHELDCREQIYLNNALLLKENINYNFKKNEYHNELNEISQRSDLTNLIVKTFYSILSTKYYHTNELCKRISGGDAQAEEEYILCMRSINNAHCKENNISVELLHTMIMEAWDAAIRYTAISLTDKEVGIWSILNPDGIKLTIHGKKGEIQFRPTGSEFLSMTPQHCVGGIKANVRGNKMTYQYRIERESYQQTPVILTGSDCDTRRNIKYQQPIFYIDATDNIDPSLIISKGINLYE